MAGIREEAKQVQSDARAPTAVGYSVHQNQSQSLGREPQEDSRANIDQKRQEFTRLADGLECGRVPIGCFQQMR